MSALSQQTVLTSSPIPSRLTSICSVTNAKSRPSRRSSLNPPPGRTTWVYLSSQGTHRKVLTHSSRTVKSSSRLICGSSTPGRTFGPLGLIEAFVRSSTVSRDLSTSSFKTSKARKLFLESWRKMAHSPANSTSRTS